ncbi:bacterio-opsin activator [Haloferax sp. Atlit-6N]|uniref:bacterio-opsin activator domain-containing protein n=1 Tax=Haloferax sp. Atlit-6N TaxID=2077205 RepID=UPI000E242B80|nr:bacterio-opsin activator domain-containing protein [Haloferax sp. Atlit-6N]REA02851.1 bacterio-opsin activator [Haloferax sp. Atlit-6N]
MSGVSDSGSVLVVGESDWVTRFAEGLDSRPGVTVLKAETKAAALRAVEADEVDCVVVDADLADAAVVDLLTDVRSTVATLPVVVAADGGSDVLASEVLGAGATDYVALDADSPDVETLLARTGRALRSARQSAGERERARQFDAMFDDERTATWVLDGEGSLTRANRTAREFLDAPVDPLVGGAFWSLPWWSNGDDPTSDDVRRLVEDALGGTAGNAVVPQPSETGRRRIVELSVRPVTDERGEVASVVVEGIDITARVSLERDLRRSEELHRVTLNNMTDTVLITDESGAYTYVCPNVHFIFGYTADELRERVPIDELLGEDLFDRDELAERGVLKNIESTVTDKAGREHTLLVNVREVSIRDGTLLFSCRDITKRKQREDALTTLHETAREFLYTGTHRQIAQRVVDDTPGVLALDASAVYLFDADANALRPAAYSPAMREAHGPLPTVPADGETLPSHSFVEDSALYFDDVHEADRLENSVTGLRSVAYVPLGDHGVFVAGSTEVGAFDAVARELTDLLAVTAEAALDRVTRESRLREQDRTLQRQNDRLTELNRINETIREIDQALVGAQTREEIDYTVCELLTAADRFAFAWVGSVDPIGETVEPRAWAGDERGYLDSTTFEVAASSVEPAGRTAATGEVTTVPNVASGFRDEPWRKGALTRDYLSVLSIPLVYNDLSHGVLTVYATTHDAFDETATAVLAELGETIASALSALERKNALLTTAVTRVGFAVDDPTFVLSRLARDAGCTLTYRGGVQQSAEGNYVFVTVEDGAVESVAAAADELVAVADVRRISTDGDAGVLRLRLTQPFLAPELADHGAVLGEVRATPEETTLVVDVPESIDVRNVTHLVDEAFAGVELRTKQTLDRSTERDLFSRFLDKLTERQLEVLQTAYYSGYFESPRENTGEDVAATLGISPPAFYKHVRTVQRKLFATLFDEHSGSATGRGG